MIGEHKKAFIPQFESTQFVQPTTFAYYSAAAIINIHGL
jgi:hypothetical protein